MKVKAAELSDAALDWAVAVINYKLVHGVGYITCIPPGKGWVGRDEHRYSTDWAQGGPIIDLEKITLAYLKVDGEIRWEARYFDNNGRFRAMAYGPTPLIAAMRCFVASRLGDEVDVPDELVAHAHGHADVPEDQATAHRPRSRA